MDCETEDVVDDVRVRPVSGSTLAIQVKHTLTLSEAPNGELAKTIRQFVAHHRSLDHDSDLLVLIISPGASGPVRDHLARFLDRVQHTDPSTPVASIALTSKSQIRARSVLTSLISSAWREQTGRAPTEAELRGVLAVMRVVVLDVEPDGVDERQARELLRAQVVATADTADAAWSRLVEHFARLAAQHGGADRAQLQTVIAQANIQLQVPVDYRADIERLEAFTSATLSALQPSLLTIPTAAGPVTLPRPAIDLVEQRAQQASLLVIGQAGAGKTVALGRLTERLLADDKPVLAVAVGSTAASSLGELRNELGLDHDLFEVLQAWRPGQGGVLILDALDAARTEPQADLWRRIIEYAVAELGGWRVVASVRTWDLRHSVRLRTLFPADPARTASLGFVDEEFGSVEHLHIPVLDDNEFSALRASSPEIDRLLADAPAEVTDLLRNLFNLRLAAELLLAGAGIGELHQLRTQLQLLERYWAFRVSDEPGGLAREEILRRACDHALGQHTLSIPRPVLLTSDISSAVPLGELLSRHVLEETVPLAGGPPPQTLRFAHHILFDYAVASTVLAGLDDPSLLARLRDDAAVALFARPSIDMHLERLWNADRGRFWEVALQGSGEDPRPGLVCVIFAEVAARRAERLEDLAALLDAAAQPSPPAGTIRLWRDLVVAVVLDRQNDLQAPLGVWPQVVARLSAHVAATEYPLRILLDDLVRAGPPLAGDDLDHCGIAARRLLEYAWTQSRTPAVRLAIEAAVATAASDPTTTETLLRQAIAPTQLEAWGYQDLHWIAKAVPHLATLIPGFVEDLYVAVLPYEETSPAPTPLLSSAILGLRSNRRQDFDLVKWELVEQFPVFLATAPSHALTVLDRLVAVTHDLQPDAAVTLQISSRTFSVIPDGSGWCDHRSYTNQHDLASLLDKFEKHLAEAAREDPPRLARVLDLLASKPRPAVLWRRAILAAASKPLAATDLMSLCWTPTALVIDEFEEPLAALIETTAPELSADDRARIEATVVALHPGPDDGSDAWRQQDLRFRRFFHALGLTPSVDSVATTPNGPTTAPEPRHQPVVAASFSRSAEGPQRYGIDLHSDADHAAWALIEALNEFSDEHLNGAPPPDSIPGSVALADQLTSHRENLSPEVKEHADGALARAAERWTRASDIPQEVLSKARAVLLEFRSHPKPQPRPADQDDSSRISVIPQGPRGDAARGLIQLASRPEHADDELLNAVEELTRDPVPWVRYSIARGLVLLRRSAPEVMWRLLRQVADTEAHDDVLRAVVLSAFQLRSIDLDTTVDVVKRVTTRASRTEEHESAIEACAEAAGIAWVQTGHAGARRLLDEFLGADDMFTQPLLALMHEVRSAGLLTIDDEAMRQRALTLCDQTASIGLARIADLNEVGPSPDPETATRLRSGAQLLDGVAMQLYFASGAQGARESGTVAEPSPAGARLFREARPLISRLARAPLPPATHYLVEILEYVLAAEPEPVLLALQEIVTVGGHAGGYQHETLAIDAIVRIVERYLANHRGILQRPEHLAALHALLDVFIDAGWPQAHRLVYSLDEIFR